MKQKNGNVYFYVYKTQILKSLAYKFDVYGNIIMQTIIMIATAFFWKALFRNATMVKGVTVDTMLTYTVISSMLSVVLTTGVERRITDSVQKGTIAIDMMRPVNLFKVFFAENLIVETIVNSAAVKVKAELYRLFLVLILTKCDILITPVNAAVAHVGIRPHGNNTV